MSRSDNNTVMTSGLTETICTIARDGLCKCYPKEGNETPYTLVKDGEGDVKPAGNSIRYALISQIGISKWLKYQPKDKAYLPDLWPRILACVDNINNIGDLGLLLWAASESGRDDSELFAKILVQQWPDQKNMCNAVELGWIVQSLVCLSALNDLTADAHAVLTSASERLLGLYKPVSRLFARHNRTGLTEKLSRRIACFADQVYPILALANYGRNFNNTESIVAAVAVADNICRLQGPLGQWWWNYDVKTGKVAEEYPVFSVHQHGMAPMALFAIDAIAGTNHKPYIEKGLVWLDEQNELNEQMIEPDKGIIWRDIHRREFGKMFRLVRGLLVTVGLDGLHRLTGRSIFGYVVNRECRPYELGWLLYAWAGESLKIEGNNRI